MKTTLRENSSETEQQVLFMRRHKFHHRQVGLARFVLMIVFLVVWEYSSRSGLIDSFFFSCPSQLLQLFVKLCAEGSIFAHLAATLLETLVSFSLVFLVSLLFATIMWYSPKTSEVIEPYLVILNSLPKSALAPLFIVWLGTGMKTIIIAGMSVALFGSIISFYTAFRQCDPEKISLIYTLGGHKRDCYKKIVLPSSVPLLLSTTKVNIGLSLVGVIIGEFLAARRGLGYLIIYGSQIFQLDLVILNIIILCLIATGLYKLIQLLEHRIRKKMQL